MKKEKQEKNKIEDFGEYIPGARKDSFAKRINAEDVTSLSHKEILKYCVKKNFWEKPNYKEMVDNGVPKTVAFTLSEIYKAFPGTIKSYGNEERDRKVADEYIRIGEKLSKIKFETLDDIKNIKNELIDMGVAKPIYPGNSRIMSSNEATKLNLDIDRFLKKLNDMEYYNYEEVINREIERTGFPDKQDPWRKGMFVKETHFIKYDGVEYSRKNPLKLFSIYKKVGKSNKRLKDFKTKEEAEKYLNVDLKKEYEEKKKKNVIEVRPQLKHLKRKGINFRNDKNITTELFQKTFEFRGGQFGTWNSQEDRQQNLNLSFDSLVDISKVLGISLKGVSLNGTLAIAYGSRGHGGRNSASAHFEPIQRIINLTKMKGAGSLAHEWFHALDEFLGARSGVLGVKEFLLSEVSSGRMQISMEKNKLPKETEMINNIRNNLKERLMTDKEIKESFEKILDDKKDELIRILTSDIVRRTGKKSDEIKKEFADLLTKENSSDDFKKQIINMAQKLEKADIEFNIQANYITHSLLDVIKAEEKFKDYKSQVGVLKCETDYFKSAKQFDSARSKPYFSQDVELMARAFETYVERKLKENNLRNDYLVYGTTNSSLYPSKKEMDIIAPLFDKLFEEITVLDKSELIGDNFKLQEDIYENKDYTEKEETKEESEGENKENTSKEETKEENRENISKEKTKEENKENTSKEESKEENKENTSKEENVEKLSKLLDNADLILFSKNIENVGQLKASVNKLDESNFSITMATDEGQGIKKDDWSNLLCNKKEAIELLRSAFTIEDCISKTSITPRENQKLKTSQEETKEKEEVKKEVKEENKNNQSSKDKEIGEYPYKQLLKEGKVSYIRINKEEFEKVKQSNIRHSAFLKPNGEVNLVVADKDKNIVTEILDRKNSVEWNKDKIMKTKDNSFGNITYKQLNIEAKGKLVYKLIPKELANDILNKMGDIKYCAFVKKDTGKLNIAINKKDEIKFDKIKNIVEKENNMKRGNKEKSR